MSYKPGIGASIPFQTQDEYLGRSVKVDPPICDSAADRDIPLGFTLPESRRNRSWGSQWNSHVALCTVWPLHDHPVSISLLETNVFMLKRMENLGYLFLPRFPLQPFKSVALAKRAWADNQLVSPFFPSQLWWSTSLTVWCGEEAGWVFPTTHACTDADF